MPNAFTECLDEPIHVMCGVICTNNTSSYLRVSTDVLWLTPDMLGEEFDIYSNVNWKID